MTFGIGGKHYNPCRQNIMLRLSRVGAMVARVSPNDLR